MNDSHRCPKCKLFIIGTYCYTCNEDIHEIRFDTSVDDMLKDIFEENNE